MHMHACSVAAVLEQAELHKK